MFTPTNLPASAIGSGKLDLARLPTGTDETSVALGSHSHDAADILTGKLEIGRLPTGTDGQSVALGDHTHDASAVVSGTLDVARLPALPRSALEPRARTALGYFWEAEDDDINKDVAPDAEVVADASASGGKVRRFLGDPATDLGGLGRLWGRDGRFFPGPVVFSVRVRVSNTSYNGPIARLLCGEARPSGGGGWDQPIVPAGINTTNWVTLSIVCPFNADATNQFVGIESFDKTRSTNLSLDYVTVRPGTRAEPALDSTKRFACRKDSWEHVGQGVICSVDIHLAQPSVVMTSMNGHWFSTSPAAYAWIRINGQEPMDAKHGRIHEYFTNWGTMSLTSTWELGPGRHTVEAYCDQAVCRANGVAVFGIVVPK